ncbi:MAG: TonB-dependent receptor [Halioglobus sp.]
MQPRFIKTAIAATLYAISSQYAHAQLEEVIVTAQKRTQSMQDVPVAVSAFGGTDIDNLGWSKPSDVANQVPNMQLSQPFGEVQPQFSIRGVSMIDWNPTQSSPIGLYIDEAYMGSSWLHGLSMYDTERIEVLRGPQGTLYGKNTTGGAINLITRTPGMGDETNGYIKLGTGNYGLLESNGAIEGTLIDEKLSARLAFNYKDRDGIYENNFPGGDDMAETSLWGLRASFNFQATENLNAVLKFSYGESDATASVSQIFGTNPGGVDILGNTDVIKPKYLEGSVDHVEAAENDMSMVNLKLNWDIGDYSVVSVTSYYDGSFANPQDIDGTKAPYLHVDFYGESKAFSQDLRLVSNFDGPFNFIAGAYYGDEDVDSTIVHSEFVGSAPDVSNIWVIEQPAEFNPARLDQKPLLLLAGENGGAMGEVWRDLDVEKESWAIYTDMTYDFNDKWSLNLGLRYTDDETTRDTQNNSRLNGTGLSLPPALTGAPVWIPTDPRTEGTWVGGNEGNIYGLPFPFIPPGNPAGPPIWTHADYTSASAEALVGAEEEITGTLALNYQVNEDIMSYFRYSHGYRSGEFNGGLVYASEGDSAYVNPEYVDSYELGLKSEFADGTIRLNAAAFYYDYEDQQFANQVGISTTLENAGGVDIYGLELELLAMPAEGLTLQAGLGLVDAEYNELILTSPTTASGFDDFKGNEPVSTPDTNFNMAVDYDFDISANWRSWVHVDTTYTSSQWFSAYNDAVVPGVGDYGDLQQESYWIWNARVGVSDNSDSYAVSLWVDNMADEEYYSFAVALQTLGLNSFSTGLPRTYGIDFTYRF